jgi:hypothetical protein
MREAPFPLMCVRAQFCSTINGPLSNTGSLLTKNVQYTELSSSLNLHQYSIDQQQLHLIFSKTMDDFQGAFTIIEGQKKGSSVYLINGFLYTKERQRGQQIYLR